MSNVFIVTYNEYEEKCVCLGMDTSIQAIQQHIHIHYFNERKHRARYPSSPTLKENKYQVT